MPSLILRRAIKAISAGLQRELKTLPDSFCGSFQYTTIGKNLTHPIILGALCHCLRQLPSVRHVGVDVRLNRVGTGVKFQPDVVAYSDDALERPLLLIDYESPNSSDLRVIEKDLLAYQRWRGDDQTAPPYIVVTTLPAVAVPSWELRWTYKEGYNAGLQGMRADVSRNPLNFWTAQWLKHIRAEMLEHVTLMNIDRQSVSILALDAKKALP
ncbi:MAG: hypothetical protein JSR78_11020 [Proteobacteria bacterium]|nr:hypothetical protein [Pseudomonadota bacterium]